MKKILYILLLVITSSCDVIDMIDGCEEPTQVELSEQDKKWLTDSIQYFTKEIDTFKVRSGEFVILDRAGVINCEMPIQHQMSIQVDDISYKNIYIYASIYKSPKETNISYSFSKDTPDNLIVGVNQIMGMIDLEGNQVVPLDNIDFIHGEYLGNHTIRGREYTEVYRFTDLDESNVPEIDVASIIVSPMGFLRIEFYDGEVWERVIVE